MERRFSALALGLLALLFLSCEAVFTTSLFEWAQRDPSSLSRAGKLAYARDALDAGDRDAMSKAYRALKDSGDPELYPFTAELALGAAGVTEALNKLLGNIASSESDQDDIHQALEEAFASFKAGDLVLIEEAADLIRDAETVGASISLDQYFIAGVGLLVVALDEAGGEADAIDVTTPGGPGETAIDFFTAAAALADSDAQELLNDLIGYF